MTHISDSEMNHDPEANHGDSLADGQGSRSADNCHTSDDPSKDNSPEHGLL